MNNSKTITIAPESKNPLTVSRLGYGTMRLAAVFNKPAPKKEDAIEILQQTQQHNVNFIDTADFYGAELTNKLIEEALYPYKENLVICTKVGAKRTSDNQLIAYSKPGELRESIENNLRTLKLSQIKLVHFRVMNNGEGFEESMEAMYKMQQEGKILHVGVSNVTADQLKIAMQTGNVATVQNMFGYYQRTDLKSHGIMRGAKELLPVCEANKIVLTPFFSLQTADASKDGKLKEMANKYNVTESQMNIAWLLNLSTCILPIPGTSSLQHFQENMKALNINISKEDMEYLG